MLLKRDGSIPLYRQIRQYLEYKITSGEWQPGEQIPTEKELSSHFQVSTITVKRAILDLVNSGMLYRISGKGTFVNKPKEINLTKLVSLHDKFSEEKFYPHKTIKFTIIKADSQLAKQLHINEHEEVYHISRIKLEDEKPIVFENSWIPKKLTPGLTKQDIENNLLYNVFSKKYSLSLDKAKVYISAKTAGKEEAALLQVPIGEQLLVLDRITSVNKKMIIEYSHYVSLLTDAKFYLEIDL